MKLLIVTSEPLSKKDTLSSTFELTQAEILSERFDVAIISIGIHGSLGHLIKFVIKSFKNPINNIRNIKETLLSILKAVNFLFFGKSYVNKHLINGITVYEGVGYKLFSYSSFEKDTKLWTKIGMHAYQAYCNEKLCPTIIHAHGRFLMAGILALKIKRKYNIPYIYTEHSTFYKRGIAPEGSKLLLMEVVENASLFIAVSKPLLQSITAFLGQKPLRSLIIPNVVDKRFETPLNKLTDEKLFTFITVASLDYKKGIDILINSFKSAFKKIPNVQLLICGDGPLRLKLELLAFDLGLNNSIKFLGIKTKLEIKELLDSANVFVLPSRAETFGVVVIEALARGCPVIATKSGGPELILCSNWGILVEPENEDKLSNALLQIKSQYDTYDSKIIYEESLILYGSKTFLAQMDIIYNSLINKTL